MEQKVERIWRELYGNGNDGIKADLVVLKEKIIRMEADSERIATALSGINKYITEHETIDALNKKQDCLKRERRNNRIVQVLMLLAIITSIAVSIWL